MSTAIVSEKKKQQVHRAELEIMNGPLKGTTYALERDPTRWLVAGRSPATDLCIHDNTVSMEHFRIQIRGDAVVLQPLISTNGTFVGSVYGSACLPPQSEIVLGDQAVFYAGRVRLRLRWAEHEEVPIVEETNLGGRLFGISEIMRCLFSQIVRASRTTDDVLITGEVGTGKDETARLIHELSQRANKPFVKIDCMEMAFDERFSHILMFGYAGSPGLLENAAGGVVYMDGIDELPRSVQRKLVSLVEQRTFRRTDEREERPIDVRLICSSPGNPHKGDQNGFLAQLLHRLNIVLDLPPLRHRLIDISILAPLFARQFSEETGRELVLSQEVISYLGTLPWKGNVLELRHYIRHTAMMTNADCLSLTDLNENSRYQSDIEQFAQKASHSLEQAVTGRTPSKAARKEIIDEFIRTSMKIAVRTVGRSSSDIAKLLGVTDRTVRNQLCFLLDIDESEKGHYGL